MELYREDEREEVYRDGQEDERGMKRRETNPASNQFLRCSPPSGTQRFTELDREEMGEKRDRGHLVEKKESPEEERVVKPVISLSGKLG